MTIQPLPNGRRSYGTGSLTVRRDRNGHEKWYARFYVGERQVQRSLGPKRQPGASRGLTRSQAERVLQQLIDAERALPLAGERLSLDEAGERYLIHLERVMQRKATTLQDYRIMLRRHLVPFFAGRSLDRIDAQLVSEYLIAKRREGLASKTVGNQLTFLHGVFRHAMKNGWTRANPVAAVDRPRDDAVDPDIRFLDHEEVEALLRAVPDDDPRWSGTPPVPPRGHGRAAPGRAARAPLARRRLGRRSRPG